MSLGLDIKSYLSLTVVILFAKNKQILLFQLRTGFHLLMNTACNRILFAI